MWKGLQTLCQMPSLNLCPRKYFRFERPSCVPPTFSPSLCVPYGRVPVLVVRDQGQVSSFLFPPDFFFWRQCLSLNLELFDGLEGLGGKPGDDPVLSQCGHTGVCCQACWFPMACAAGTLSTEPSPSPTGSLFNNPLRSSENGLWPGERASHHS